MVGVARIELATPAMSTRCSTTELYAHSSAASSDSGAIVQASIIFNAVFFAEQPLHFANQIAQMERF